MSNLPKPGSVINVPADGLPDEFRSIWTDLRHVSFSVGWIDVNGISTRYIRSGNPESPKLIMLPGTGGHAEVFAPNFSALSGDFDCWAIDMIGHGYTDKPDQPYDTTLSSQFLSDFMDAIEAEKADFVAISVASMHLMRLAQSQPERVGKMVLVTPFGMPMPKPEATLHNFWVGKETPPEDGRADAAKAPSFEIAKKILSTVVADIDQIPDDMIAARFDTARQPGAPEVFKHVMWWMNTELRLEHTFTDEELSKIDHETLAIVGAGDPVFVPNGEGVAEAMPNCGCVIVDGASHWPNYEDPASFNRLCYAFLKS